MGQINIEKKRKLIEMIQYIYPSFDFGSCETWEAFLEQRIDKIRDLSVELQHKKIYFLKYKACKDKLMRETRIDSELAVEIVEIIDMKIEPLKREMKRNTRSLKNLAEDLREML